MKKKLNKIINCTIFDLQGTDRPKYFLSMLTCSQSAEPTHVSDKLMPLKAEAVKLEKRSMDTPKFTPTKGTCKLHKSF